MTRTRSNPSPFRREGLLRRTAPFLVAMAVAFAAIRLPAVERNTGELVLAGGLNLLVIALVVVLPWERLPAIADLLPILLYMVVITLLRDGLGGAVSAYAALLILPVLWLGMYGTRLQLAVAVLGVAVLLGMPILVIGAPDYPSEEWRRALLWVTVSGIVGLAVQDLVQQVRQRADALHTVSAAVGRRTREIETRSAICEAAKGNAGAQFALLLEPDANGRRLVTTAATDRLVENSEVFLSDTEAPAVKSYVSAREVFEQHAHEPPFIADNGSRTASTSVLWHPVPGRDGAMGVLALAWTEPVKRLPDTLAPVMEALAAEAAGVIERTTLLLKLETVVKVDSVTGLPNERAWEEEVPRELSRARREDSPLSVVLLDLGDFELGPEGEPTSADKRVLRAAADRWREALGPSDFLAHRDIVGRFAALFPNHAPEEAEQAALRLQRLAPQGRPCAMAVVTWNGSDLPAALVERAETQIELERAAARAD